MVRIESSKGKKMSEDNLMRRLLSKAMAHCSRREYCSYDMLGKLQLWGLEADEAEKVLTILIKENFINDLRYSSAFVRDKFNYNKWGKVKIGALLRSKQIPDSVIKLTIESIDDKEYIKVLRDLISNHKRSVKSKNNYELKGKLLRYGLSRGFESSLLYDILNDLEE